MESASYASSEEELLRLREEGKISEREYEELLGAMKRPPADQSPIAPPVEPQFQAFHKRILIGGLIICPIGVIFGLVLKLPLVWMLGMIGMIVVPFKYHLIHKRSKKRQDD